MKVHPRVIEGTIYWRNTREGSTTRGGGGALRKQCGCWWFETLYRKYGENINIRHQHYGYMCPGTIRENGTCRYNDVKFQIALTPKRIGNVENIIQVKYVEPVRSLLIVWHLWATRESAKTLLIWQFGSCKGRGRRPLLKIVFPHFSSNQRSSKIIYSILYKSRHQGIT